MTTPQMDANDDADTAVIERAAPDPDEALRAATDAVQTSLKVLTADLTNARAQRDALNKKIKKLAADRLRLERTARALDPTKRRTVKQSG